MRIGIDLGGTNIRMGIISDGIILRKIEEPTRAHQTETEIIDHLIQMIRQLMNTNIRGIGIGVPSVVDSEKGIVYNAVNIPAWKEVYLKQILENEFGIRVMINNDCNCFAFGERYYGQGTIYQNLVCVTLGTGVGAGIIINNQLYNGNNTGAGEIGSLYYLDSDFEHYCSGMFFSQKYKTTGSEMFKKAIDGDSLALAVWDELGGHLGYLMNTILFTYDPQAIIIGGGLSEAFNLFSPHMLRNMAKFPYPETIKRLKIHVSQNKDIALLGAAALVS